jgi:hypothetical protein
VLFQGSVKCALAAKSITGPTEPGPPAEEDKSELRHYWDGVRIIGSLALNAGLLVLGLGK